MESVLNQPTSTIDWNEWSRLVDAAQDPQHREAVQKFLAQANLSGEIPAALDENVLAPRRAAGATGEQCAYVLCNLGFAAMAIPASTESAEFVMGCARLVEQLAPGSPDLRLRRHFLSAKAGLVVAAITDQPHLHWDNAAERCTAFLRTLDDSLDMLPNETVEANATAAFSFASQFLSRLVKVRAVDHYADEVSRLIETALGLADRLPSSFVSRMWRSLIPGKNTSVFFRQIGAAAECTLQMDGQSLDHAEKGLKYVDAILSQATNQSGPDVESILQLRAELLLLSGRHSEAAAQAEALERSSERSVRECAIALKARCHLQTGRRELALELLTRVAPTREQVLKRWHTIWIGDAADGYWTNQADFFLTEEDGQGIWRVQAAAAADSEDIPAFLDAADRSTGFLADSLFRDRQQWMRRTNPVSDVVDPMAAIDRSLSQLGDGAALLQAMNTPEGILTWIARKQNGRVSVSVAPDRPNVKRMTEVRKQWGRTYFNSLRRGIGSPDIEAQCAIVFSELMDAVRANWGDLLQELIEDGVTHLILIGDDLVDIPLHATRIGSENECLIDCVPVTYVPSISALQACTGRKSVDESARSGIEVQHLADSDLDSDAQVLQIVARATHNARMPLASSLGVGDLEISIAQIIEGLELPRCEIVSILNFESTLPSTVRAPGFDISTVFLAAGARSVLASTWVLNDEIATEMAQLFLQRWVSGLAPSAAFQQALLQLRAEQPPLPDFFWAGMRLLGAP